VRPLTSVPLSIYLVTCALTTTLTRPECDNLWHHRRRERTTVGASLDARSDRKLAKCTATALALRGGWLCPRGGIDERQKLLQCFGRFDPKRAGDVNELDDAQAAFTALVFGDERLGTRKSLGDIFLCQALGLPQVAQQRLERTISMGAQRFAHLDEPVKLNRQIH
jgi:hypothetical protein